MIIIHKNIKFDYSSQCTSERTPIDQKSKCKKWNKIYQPNNNDYSFKIPTNINAVIFEILLPIQVTWFFWRNVRF